MSFAKSMIAVAASIMLTSTTTCFAGGVGAGNQLPSEAKDKASGSPEVKDKGKSAGGSMKKGDPMEKKNDSMEKSGGKM